MEKENEIILYHPDSSISLEVRVEDETVWLTQQQMGELFQTTRNNITLHIRNIFKEGELEEISVCKESLLTASDGKKYKTRFYNLDVIISVGYRIKSKRGTDFRIWSTKVLKDYMLKGYAIHQRFERLEYRMAKTEEQLDLIIRTSLPPSEGIFFNGEIFDAYTWLNARIAEAQKRIIVIDPYADITILQHLTRRKDDVECRVYTSAQNKLIKLDIKKFNSQYPKIQLYKNYSGHDRFLVIDDIIYHVGGSMKDLGNRLMAYSILYSITVTELLAKIDKK